MTLFKRFPVFYNGVIRFLQCVTRHSPPPSTLPPSPVSTLHSPLSCVVPCYVFIASVSLSSDIVAGSVDAMFCSLNVSQLVRPVAHTAYVNIRTCCHTHVRIHMHIYECVCVRVCLLWIRFLCSRSTNMLSNGPQYINLILGIPCNSLQWTKRRGQLNFIYVVSKHADIEISIKAIK